ncbi:MAG: FAD-binding protein [Devosia sp.]
MATLILADYVSGSLAQSTARTVSAAAEIGSEIDILVAGSACEAIAREAARITGVRKILLADDAALDHQLAEPVSELLAGLAADYDVLMASTSSVAKNIMPRVAALLDVMQISEIIAVVSADTFKRPIYAGNAIETVRSSDAKKIITVRTTAFEPAGQDNAAPIEPVAAPRPATASVFLDMQTSKADRPSLTSARVVVSGGRALGSKEEFDRLIGPFADKLGAAIGASRAAVDAGFAPNDYQVGQTGKIVAPELYIACGISGAIQHVAGMKDSHVIVAINSDPDAPIFQIADYGLVADLFVALPELTTKI